MRKRDGGPGGGATLGILALLGGALALVPGASADVRVLGGQNRGIDLIASVSLQGSPVDTRQATRLADPNDPGRFREGVEAEVTVPAVGASRARGAHESALAVATVPGSWLADACGWGDLVVESRAGSPEAAGEGRARSFYELELEVRDAPAPFDLQLQLRSGLGPLTDARSATLTPEARLSLEETDLGLRIVDTRLADPLDDRLAVDRARRFRGVLLPGRYRLVARADVDGQGNAGARGEGFATFELALAVPEPGVSGIGALGSLLAAMAALRRRGSPQSRSVMSRVRASCSS